MKIVRPCGVFSVEAMTVVREEIDARSIGESRILGYRKSSLIIPHDRLTLETTLWETVTGGEYCSTPEFPMARIR